MLRIAPLFLLAALGFGLGACNVEPPEESLAPAGVNDDGLPPEDEASPGRDYRLPGALPYDDPDPMGLGEPEEDDAPGPYDHL